MLVLCCNQIPRFCEAKSTAITQEGEKGKTQQFLNIQLLPKDSDMEEIRK